jgi:hypothetical protein
MPNPIDYQFSVPLTNWVRRYPIETQTMAQDRVAPIVQRKTAKGEYQYLGLEMYNLHVDDTLGNRTEPHELFYDAPTTTFTTKEYGAMIFVSNKEKAEALSPLDPVRQGILTCQHFLRLKKEQRVVTLAEATSNSTTPSFDWDDDDSATIVKDIATAKAGLKANHGFAATDILFGDHIADEIVGQADIIDLIKYSAALQKPQAILDNLSGEDLPPRIFRMNRITPTAMWNNAQPSATASYKNLWADHAYLFVNDNANQSAPWAKTFQSLGMSVRTVPEAKRGARGGMFVICSWEYVVTEVTDTAIYQIDDVT